MRETSTVPRPAALVPLVALLLPVLAVTPAQAQEPTTGHADPADVATIDGIVGAFYEVVSGPAGEPRQWDRDATLYWPGTVFTVPEDGEGPGFHNVTPAAFADESDRFLVESGFVEREIHRETHRFGPVAQVWSTYEWRTADGETGRGINGLQLLHDGERWWITHATWDNETAERPIPEEYLPDE
ncbi:MAG: hypothetical protein ACREK5_01400 [Gemmatimonadota bacterium]